MNKFVVHIVCIISLSSCGNHRNFQEVGDILRYVPVAAGAAVALYKQDGEGALQLGTSFISTIGATQLTKSTFQDSKWGVRPDGGTKSFISGHTSFACAGATFLSTRYGFEYGAPAFLVATAVAASRLQSDKHHMRDVIGGCALAYGIGKVFVTEYEDISIRPIASPNFIGLQAGIKF